MMKKLLSLGAAALAALVGGCGDGPSTVPGGYRNPATWSTFFAATSSGPLLLEVHGDPFGVSAAELRNQVAKAMSAAIPARPFAMTTDPQAASLPKVKVVVALGAPANQDAAELCAGRVATSAAKADGGRIDVMAVFCHGGAQMSWVRGWVSKVNGPGDARFVRLMGQVMRDLAGDPQ
ncbi:hypothetical protein WV31_03005 [Magnetospirillum sp. ME-1]|uniref:hypothetical protein n=1 Tax=Magnetospirillum sp. ME-1 TaxID=1639348 RepID=UPI000A17E240|nr:hypothetical protein [Magnetospirillum sp. ME-1]ARJ64711.1 hypothetical protein WV31_03005 [Magnetospirillum sp. ME-1]